MFDKFGEFNSVTELNAAAKGQKEQGDKTALIELARENGIDTMDAEDYFNGYTGELATLSMAAYGRIAAEENELEKESDYAKVMAVKVIITMLKSVCTDTDIQSAVMRKGKRITDIYSGLRKGAEKHKHGNAGISCGTDRQLCEIIKTYYLGSSKAFEEKIEDLYSEIKEKEKEAKEKKYSTDKKAGEKDAKKKD